MKARITILKLGGSVITNKENYLTPNIPAIDRLAEEISKANMKSIIIVHGGGSYGHPLAEKYKLAEGYSNPSQLLQLSHSHEIMIELNRLVIRSLLKNKVPAISIPTISVSLTRKGRIEFFAVKSIEESMKTGLIPVLFGDFVLDTRIGFTVLSGDQIASFLAVKLKAKKLILGVDVDGLYTGDPKVDSSAVLIRNITLRDLMSLQKKISGALVSDVTGGMAGKINEMILPVQSGIPVFLVNALKPGNIFNALRGKRTNGTKIGKQ